MGVEKMKVFSGEKLREALEKANMSQTELGLRIGVRQNVICLYANNRIQNPRLSTIGAIARVLGINVSELLKERRK